jgi:spore germination cell wall hydrolase CwlJ-like protein
MKFLVNVGSAVVAAALISFLPKAVASAYNPDFDSKQIEQYNEQRQCLALNIYHEAKGESELGQRAVAYVTLNRANDDRYPSNICDVVKQARLDNNGQPRRNQCQFSWYCDGRGDEPVDPKAYEEAMLVASIVINTYGSSFDPTMGATMYHADSVKPKWRKSFEETTQIENHIFYR